MLSPKRVSAPRPSASYEPLRGVPFALGWPRDDVACWLRAMPLDDAATELLRRIDRETLSHLMLKAGMHTYPPRLVVASREELVRLATAQLEDDHVHGRTVLDLTAAMLVVAAVALGASAASVARARELWPEPRPWPPPDVLPPLPVRSSPPEHQTRELLLPPQHVAAEVNLRTARKRSGAEALGRGSGRGSGRARSWGNSSSSEEESKEESEEESEGCMVSARAPARSAAEMREERALLRALHPDRMDWQADLDDALPSHSAVHLPPPPFSGRTTAFNSARSGGRDDVRINGLYWGGNKKMTLKSPSLR